MYVIGDKRPSKAFVTWINLTVITKKPTNKPDQLHRDTGNLYIN